MILNVSFRCVSCLGWKTIFISINIDAMMYQELYNRVELTRISISFNTYVKGRIGNNSNKTEAYIMIIVDLKSDYDF